MTELVFVDSTTLVYCRDTADTAKHERAVAWLRHLWDAQTGRVSVQVFNEFYATVTKKLKPGMSRDEARRYLRTLLAWQPLPLDTEVVDGAWSVQDRHNLSYWDSLIVSAALLSGCRYLLTEDLNDGQELDGLRVVDPFAHPPGSLEP